VHAQVDRSTAPRQIYRPSLITAVPSSTQLTAAWTRNRGTRWLGDQDEAAVLLDNDQHDLPPV
jgi:hypothetical protein